MGFYRHEFKIYCAGNEKFSKEFYKRIEEIVNNLEEIPWGIFDIQLDYITASGNDPAIINCDIPDFEKESQPDCEFYTIFEPLIEEYTEANGKALSFFFKLIYSYYYNNNGDMSRKAVYGYAIFENGIFIDDEYDEWKADTDDDGFYDENHEDSAEFKWVNTTLTKWLKSKVNLNSKPQKQISKKTDVTKKQVEKKPTAKKLVSKKTAVKKPAVKNPTVKKTATKKTPAKKITAKKPTAKKSTAKKTSAKKPAAKKK